MPKVLAKIALAMVLVPFAKADILTDYTSRASFAGTDSLDWGQLGPAFTTITNPVHATSTGGIGVTVSQPSGSQWERRDQGNGWAGNFANGDHLLWNQGSSAPWTMTFNQLIDGLGFQIQADFFGAFTAELQVFDGSNNLLGTFTESGNATANGDNSAIFIGIKDSTGADIKSAHISLTNAAQNPQDFAINTMSLAPGSTGAVPEPTSVILLASVVLGIGWNRWRSGKAGA